MSDPAFAPVATLEELAAQLNKHQSPDSAPNIGERLAASILAKTEDELAAFAAELDDGRGNTLVEHLSAAEDSLRQRHKLVRTAMARLCLVAVPEVGDTEH